MSSKFIWLVIIIAKTKNECSFFEKTPAIGFQRLKKTQEGVSKFKNKTFFLSESLRHIFTKFDSPSTYTLWDQGVHTNKRTSRQTWTPIKNVAHHISVNCIFMTDTWCFWLKTSHNPRWPCRTAYSRLFTSLSNEWNGPSSRQCVIVLRFLSFWWNFFLERQQFIF